MEITGWYWRAAAQGRVSNRRVAGAAGDGVSITAVVGTSVGAMNGALVALDRYDEAVTLWLDMSIEKGFALPSPAGARTTCSM